MTAIILVLIIIGAVEGNINEIFVDGYNSLWKIAIFFAVISAIYPKFAFISRRLDIQGDWDTIRRTAADYFGERGIEVENETDDKITFRRRKLAGRLAKMCEDRITLCKTDDGYVLDGMRKDIIIFSTGLETVLGDRQ